MSEPLHEDPLLPEELRHALASYRQIEPSARAREALWASVESGAGARTTGVRLRVLLGLIVSAAMLAIFWSSRHEPPAKPALPRTLAPAVQEPAAVEETGDAAAEVPAEDAPQPAPIRPRRRRIEAAPKREEQPAADLAGELALLARAKRTIAVDPARALALTVEHAERYPRGELAEEREVIAIEALARSGQRAHAEQRAAQFRADHPRSTHLARLEVVLADP